MNTINPGIPPVDLADFFDRFPNKKSIKKLLDEFVLTYPELIEELIDSVESGSQAEIKNSAHKMKGVLVNLSITRGYSLALDLEKKSAEIGKAEALARVQELSEELDKISAFLVEQEEMFR
ncbi:MAG: Hpt domain-containing protein [Bacteroidetes bacterium]|nr:Hpt domain-containing protein [Bacteroidota bacterium]